MKQSALALLVWGICCTHAMENSDPLITAIEEHNLQIVEELMQGGATIDYLYPPHSSPQWTPLGKAASLNAIEIVKLLIEKGANPNKKFYTSPLIIAVQNGHEETVKLLLEYGAEVNELYGFTTPLYKAIQKTGNARTHEDMKRYNQIIALLIGRGADLENNLKLAITYNDPWNCIKLLSWGADPSKRSLNGDNAFEFIEKNSHLATFKIRFILQAGNALNSIQSLWHSCCKSNKKETYEKEL